MDININFRMTNLEYFNYLIEKHKIFINIQPIDSWDSWIYNIVQEDQMSPFYISYQPDLEIEFKSHSEALNHAIEFISKKDL